MTTREQVQDPKFLLIDKFTFTQKLNADGTPKATRNNVQLWAVPGGCEATERTIINTLAKHLGYKPKAEIRR